MTVNKVKLFYNNNEKSISVSNSLHQKLLKCGYQVVDSDYDLAIAIGGDGSFLRMIKANNFASDIYYIGVNTGTLGFLQEIMPNEIDEFLEKLSHEFYKIESIGIQETKIITNTKEDIIHSLNEIVIRDKNLLVANLFVKVDDELLEKYTGDGLLIATSIGSTAYNTSLGGSIVYSDLHTLQITPIAPINTRSYRTLLNSMIIPETKTIQIIPTENSNNLIISIDGVNKSYDDVVRIETGVRDKKIKCLRMNNYNSTKIIHEKFLK